MRFDRRLRFVIRDGAGQYTASFDEVFAAVGADAITAPPGAAQANAFAERWVRSVRDELLDRTIIWNERQLRSLLEQYLTHYNEHRPHRSLGQRAPDRGHVEGIEPAAAIQRHTTQRTHQRVPRHRLTNPHGHTHMARSGPRTPCRGFLSCERHTDPLISNTGEFSAPSGRRRRFVSAAIYAPAGRRRCFELRSPSRERREPPGRVSGAPGECHASMNSCTTPSSS